jgi:N-acetylglucosaminyl-diphospho-decaprenol L-rhamnosyltransferase
MTAAITIHFRRPELTADCIDSLLADGWAPVLVWDNSADGGRTLCALEHRYTGEERVHLVRNMCNLGFGNGMNAALAELGRLGHAGPVLLINNDACAKPGMRPAMHALLGTAGSPALIAPRIEQDGREQGWLYYHPWLALVTHRSLPGSFAYLSGCCLLVDRADNAAPLFDDGFFMYGEDVELSWRWRRQGGQLALTDHAWLEHSGSASSGQASEAYERFLVRSHWLLAEKLAPGFATRALMRALRVPMLLARGCLRAVRHRSSTPLRALGEIVKRPDAPPGH